MNYKLIKYKGIFVAHQGSAQRRIIGLIALKTATCTYCRRPFVYCKTNVSSFKTDMPMAVSRKKYLNLACNDCIAS